jgi:hypothetical protein
MTPVTTTQRSRDTETTKTAHSSPLARASLPSTATMHKVMIRTAKRKRKEKGANSTTSQESHRYPQFSPKPVQKRAPFLCH